MAGIDDEAVMQSRLLNGVNVGGRPAPLRHLTKRFHEFVAACESPGAGGHAEDLHAALMREVGACELHLLIWRLKLRKLDKESEERDVEGSYAGVGARLRAAADEAEAELGAKRRRLEEARVEKIQFEEWRALKGEVDAYRSQEETRADLAKVKGEIAKMAGQVSHLDALQERKEAHFKLLRECLEELRSDGYPMEEGQQTSTKSMGTAR